MAFHDEMLDLASELALQDPPRQAVLRRAVSTAYYALFHLLISETTANWSRESSRHSLGRMFDHGMMRRVSLHTSESTELQKSGADPAVIADLQLVARTFCDLQKQRNLADYDLGKPWERTDTIEVLKDCRQAFDAWGRIKNEDIAQEYLVSLLIKPRD